MSLQAPPWVVLVLASVMRNGAKSLFEDLSGFDGNNIIASGDDVFFYKKLLPNILKKSII
jgi:hypothetical protein